MNSNGTLIAGVLLLAGCAVYQRPVAVGRTETPQALASLDKNTRQAVVVTGYAAGGFHARLTAWRRVIVGWTQAIGTMDAVIGRNGFAPPGEKTEGDGRTPSGVFGLPAAFGYSVKAPTKLLYRQTTENDFWVDDPASEDYNRWVTGPPRAASYERLKRDDDLYKYAIIVGYNTEPIIPGKGSAIFVHIWRGPDRPTAGCVALSENNLLKILSWLAPAHRPAIILEGTTPP